MTRCSLILLACVVKCAVAAGFQEHVSHSDGLLSAETADVRQAGSPKIEFQQRDQRYRLRKSDVIDVKFKFSPEFDQTVTIQPDGFITLDGAGDIKVEDKTIPELKEAIRQAYDRYPP